MIGQVPQTKSAVGDVFNIMSEGYRQNCFIDAKYARCDIVVNGEKYNAPQTIEMTVYEFAKFTDSSDFCLVVNDEHGEICSGSKNFTGILKRNYTAKKKESYNSYTAWTMKLEIMGSSNYIPQVRYWMKIMGQYIELSIRTIMREEMEGWVPIKAAGWSCG